MRNVVCCPFFKLEHYTIRSSFLGVLHETFGHFLMLNYEQTICDNGVLSAIGCDKNVHVWVLEPANCGRFFIRNCASR